MPSIEYVTIGAFGAGLIATLALAAVLTPARWWKRPNARALAVLAAGTWGIGSLLLSVTQAPALAGTPPAAGIAAPATAGRSYRVHEALNLRGTSGVNARRIAVVPVGATVTATGQRDGDWWEVSARIGARDVKGWASSLWLRRADEGQHR